MLPGWIMYAIYTAIAILVLALVYRMWRSSVRSTTVRPDANSAEARSRHSRTALDATGNGTFVNPIGPTPLGQVPPPLPVGTVGSFNFSAAETPSTPTAAFSPTSKPAFEAPRHWQPAAPLPPTWQSRSLFTNTGVLTQDVGTLPRVLAGELPQTASDDLMFGGATPVLASLLPEADGQKDTLQKELHTAGFYQPHALTNFAAVRYLSIIIPLVFFGALLVVVPPKMEPYVMAMVVLGPILGWALPRLYLRNKSAERRNQIEHAMPDVLDMMNMCVSQGMTVPGALSRIQTELKGVYPALAHELSIVSDQSRIASLDVALKNFADRVDVPEVNSFSSLLMQTQRMGTSVSDALSQYSDTMREGLKQRAEEKGNRATFRLLFPTVLCLMPAVYLFLLGPAVVELSNFLYSGGRDSLDTGSRVIERLNTDRGAANRDG